MKCWIYFARHGTDGPIKIGRAYDPHKRVRDLSVGSPVALILLGAMLSTRAVEEETEIHDRLRASWIRGEWFVADAALQEMKLLADRVLVPDEIRRQKTPVRGFSSTMNVRVRRRELRAWKLAARAAGLPLSQWARNIFNRRAAESDAAAEAGP